MPTSISRFSSHSLGLMRIVSALLFMQHGTQKLFGFPASAHANQPFQLLSLMGIGGVLEVFGGLLLLFGLFSRPTAFVLSGQMAVAYFLFHLGSAATSKQGFFPVVNGGDLAILFCFVFLHLFVAGPGSWAADNFRVRPNDDAANA